MVWVRFLYFYQGMTPVCSRLIIAWFIERERRVRMKSFSDEKVTQLVTRPFCRKELKNVIRV